MERFFRSLKSEWIPENGYCNFAEAKEQIIRYITGYYSRIRRHQYLELLVFTIQKVIRHFLTSNRDGCHCENPSRSQKC